MKLNRLEHNIHCSTCPVSNLCLASHLNESERHDLDKMIISTVTFEKDEYIYYAQSKIDYIYAIYSGACKEYITHKEGKEYINNFYFSGDVMGLEFFNSKTYNFSAITLAPTQVCIIPLVHLQDFLAKSKNLSRGLLHMLSRKIDQHMNMPLSTNAKQRVANFLLTLSSQLSLRGLSPAEFALPMSQVDISHKIGIAFETVSRILHNFQEQSILTLNGRTIMINDMHKLHAFTALN